MNQKKKAQKVFMLVIAFFTFNINIAKAQHETLAEVTSYLSNDGYINIGVPPNHTPIYQGASIYYYEKPGTVKGIYIYHWETEGDIPNEATAECVKKAIQISYNTDPPTYYRDCREEGNECKTTVEYKDGVPTGKIIWICCN